MKNGDFCVKKGFLGGRWIAGFASLVVDWVDVDWVFNQVQGGQEVRNHWSLDIGKIKGQKNGEVCKWKCNDDPPQEFLWKLTWV